ncbi:hypothetical protein PIK44_002961 [Escherichia coli]|nr:hypothetical protein [Escherichia coli]
MKSALKKSVVSTSISLILASGMAAFAAHAADDVKLKFSTMVPYMNAMVELAKNRVPLYHIMDVAKQMENN